jgi:hypothetical protein
MPGSPIEVVGHWLQNLLDSDVLTSIVAPEATYVSLNTEDAELNQIMPWAGTVTYLQFLEDTYATAASFRADGSWTVRTEAGAEPLQV